MISIAPGLELDERDITLEFVRSSGPGGQNVNKVATAVQLRFALASLGEISDELLQRIRSRAGRRLTKDGVLVIEARRYRTQEKNRVDAVERLVALLKSASEPEKPRRPTKPTRASRERRLDSKRRRSSVKRDRGWDGSD